MRKTLLTTGLLLGLGHQYSQAQTNGYLIIPVHYERHVVQYGVFGSLQASHYTASSSADYTFRSNGGNTGFGGGLFMDLFFTSHVAFTIGLTTGTGGGDFSATYQGSKSSSATTTTVNADYNLQTRYFYLPLGLKFYTNEVLPHTRFYFQGLFSTGFLTSATNYGSETHSANNGRSSYKYVKQVELLAEELSVGVGAQVRLLDKLDAFTSVRYGYDVISAQGSPLDFINATGFYEKSGAYPLHNVALNAEIGLIYVPFRGKKAENPSPSQPAPYRSAYQAPAAQ
ncbi:MAG: outer membrane beta-barrel protein [Janthinobacterium lividum]